MISWHKISDERFKIKVKDKHFEIDTLEKLFLYSMFLNINIDEIEYALLELQKNEHNYCEFGIEKRFVFSKRIEQ